MKTLILSVRDTGGTGYTLAHAMNKTYPEHQTVNVRGHNTYLNYPYFIDLAQYSTKIVRDMIYKADNIVFLGAIKPFFQHFKLQRKQLRDKKKILLCMGSEWRWGRDLLKAQADHFFGEYKVVLGGADMFIQIPVPQPDGTTKLSEPVGDDVAYLPVVRSFSEIEGFYLKNKFDKAAMLPFDSPKRRVIYAHAPTSEATKGTEMFYAAVTRANQACPNMSMVTIRQHPWVSCLQLLSNCDVLLDQAPPFPTAYGALSVEAAAFKMPSFSRVDIEAQKWIKQKTGLTTPMITFSSEQDLFEKIVRLTQDDELRAALGQANYDYCKKLHDEAPVSKRFLDILEAM